MGMFDRLFGRGPGGYKAKAARVHELAGELDLAVRAYLEAELFDDAARVLLLKADAEPTLDRRMAFCAQAAEMARTPSTRRQALARKAMLRFDVLRGRGSTMKSELLLAAKELEEAEENEVAAEAYALAGDTEGEIRALTAAGAIEKLEEKLRTSAADARRESEQGLTLRTVEDLEKTGERRAALATGEEMLKKRGPDERLEMVLGRIRSRLVRGPIVELSIEGQVRRYALGDEVTIGRGDATIVVNSRALSRGHLRIYRRDGAAFVEDTGSRNGTFLAGARVTGPLPVGDGVTLKLGAEIPCTFTADVHDGCIKLEVAGFGYRLPLGPLTLAGFALSLDGKGGDDQSYVTLRPTPGNSAYLAEMQVGESIQLAYGDGLSRERSAPAALRVVGAAS